MKEKLKDIRIFAGGSMNLDADERLLKNNEFREVWNARMIFSGGSNVGSVENIKGTTEITPSYAPVLNSRVIGWCVDTSDGSVYYFVYAYAGLSGAAHCILRLNSDNTIHKILYAESILNFSLDYLIGANVINGILFWTDGYNPPRNINILKAYNYTNSIPDTTILTAYSAITEQILHVIKYPPIYPITGEYVNDEDYPLNNLRGKLFQFKYRYIYDNNEESVWSPISDLVKPSWEVVVGGGYYEQPTFNNRIDLEFYTGSQEVYKIDIAARVGNTGDWRLIKTFNKYNNDGTVNRDSVLGNPPHYLTDTICTYYFYNNVIGIVVDQLDSARPQDYVPLISRHQELIEKNRILYADNTEGYDNVEINVGLTLSDHWYDFPSAESQNVGMLTILMPGFSDYAFIRFWKFEIINYVDGVSDQYKLYDLHLTFGADIIPPGYPNATKHFYYQTKPGDSVVDVRDAFFNAVKSFLYEIYPANWGGSSMKTYFVSIDAAYSTDIPGNIWHTVGVSDSVFYILRSVNNAGGDVNETDYYCSDTPTLDLKPEGIIKQTFKTGSYHEFGLMYYDEQGRSGYVNTNDSCVVHIPFITDVYNGSPLGWYWDVKWSINHEAPFWAKYYQWVYTKSTSIQLHQWYIIRDEDVDSSGSHLRIKINNFLISAIDDNPMIKSPTYLDWIAGDRVRFIGKMDNNGVFLSLDKTYDYEIFKGDVIEDDYVIMISDFGIDEIIGNDTDYYLLCEVYRPRKELPDSSNDRVFYEIGGRYEINDSGSHIVTEGYLFGDCYLRKVLYDWIIVPIESVSFSEYYESNYCDIGRPQIVDRDSRQERKETDIRYGEKLYEGTSINELCKFYVANRETLPQRYGAITKIEEIGYTLRVLQEYKCTSIYLSRAELEQAIQNGASVVSGLTVVLGSQIPSEEKWGCQNPESIVADGKSMFFADVKNGSIIRWATNGLFPVSNYNVVNEVRNLFELIDVSPEDYKILGYLDGKYGEVCFTINDISGTYPAHVSSLVYIDEPHNKWMRFMEYGDATSSPEMFAYFGDRLYSFMRGRVWLHDNNSRRNYFHDTQRSMKIEIISSIEPLIKKTFESIIYNSNIKWAMSDNSPVCEMEIMPDSMNLAGMRSRLLGSNFHMHEGMYQADFLQDEYSEYPDVSDNNRIKNLFKGRDLMGNSILIRMSNDLTSEVVLFSVEINATKSY